MAALAATYAPQGYNVGWNLGRIAGAGIVDHVHLHVVPRWAGDTNFMPVLADVKVLPEHLAETRDEARRRLAYLSDFESRPKRPRTTSRSSCRPVVDLRKSPTAVRPAAGRLRRLLVLLGRRLRLRRGCCAIRAASISRALCASMRVPYFA